MNARRNHDEARERILCGGDVQITITQEECFFEKDARWGLRTFGELRLRGGNDRWLKDPEIRAVAGENEPDDAGSILASFARWLEAGRKAEAVAE